MTLLLRTPTVSAGSTSSFFVDLSQITSLVNRRFYRQGINWAVAGIKIQNASGFEGSVYTMKLPNTWTMANSWEKSMRTWMRMNNEALAEAPSVRPRFLDFKIYANARHHQAGYASNLLPITLSNAAGFAVATAKVGEWEASKASIPLVSPAGAFLPGETIEREFIATGANYPGVSIASGFDALSLVEGYAASRGLPNVVDPNTPGDALDIGGGSPENWMSAIFNEGTDQDSDVIEDMITENNLAPYPFENGTIDPITGLPYTDTQYPGGANQLNGLEIHDFSFITGTTVGGTTRVKGGNFPCGLIEFVVLNSGITSNVVLTIDLIPGNHRGYLCEPMTEM